MMNLINDTVMRVDAANIAERCLQHDEPFFMSFDDALARFLSASLILCSREFPDKSTAL